MEHAPAQPQNANMNGMTRMLITNIAPRDPSADILKSGIHRNWHMMDHVRTDLAFPRHALRTDHPLFDARVVLPFNPNLPAELQWAQLGGYHFTQDCIMMLRSGKWYTNESPEFPLTICKAHDFGRGEPAERDFVLIHNKQIPLHLRWMQRYGDMNLIHRAMLDFRNGVLYIGCDFQNGARPILQEYSMDLVLGFPEHFNPWVDRDHLRGAFVTRDPLMLMSLQRSATNFLQSPAGARRLMASLPARLVPEQWPDAKEDEHWMCTICMSSTRPCRRVGCVSPDGTRNTHLDQVCCRHCLETIRIGVKQGRCVVCHDCTMLPWSEMQICEETPEMLLAQQREQRNRSSDSA